MHADADIRTTVKLRVIGRQQQLVRVDFETAPSHEALASKLRDFARMLGRSGAVVLSDYGKGGLTHIVNMIRMARAAGKPVLVDPKGDDYLRYRGATMITPNRSEFRLVAGGWKTEAELTRKANELLRRSAHGGAAHYAQRGRHDAVSARACVFTCRPRRARSTM